MTSELPLNLSISSSSEWEELPEDAGSLPPLQQRRQQGRHPDSTAVSDVVDLTDETEEPAKKRRKSTSAPPPEQVIVLDDDSPPASPAAVPARNDAGPVSRGQGLAREQPAKPAVGARQLQTSAAQQQSPKPDLPRVSEAGLASDAAASAGAEGPCASRDAADPVPAPAATSAHPTEPAAVAVSLGTAPQAHAVQQVAAQPLLTVVSGSSQSQGTACPGGGQDASAQQAGASAAVAGLQEAGDVNPAQRPVLPIMPASPVLRGVLEAARAALARDVAARAEQQKAGPAPSAGHAAHPSDSPGGSSRPAAAAPPALSPLPARPAAEPHTTEAPARPSGFGSYASRPNPFQSLAKQGPGSSATTPGAEPVLPLRGSPAAPPQPRQEKSLPALGLHSSSSSSDAGDGPLWVVPDERLETSAAQQQQQPAPPASAATEAPGVSKFAGADVGTSEEASQEVLADMGNCAQAQGMSMVSAAAVPAHKPVIAAAAPPAAAAQLPADEDHGSTEAATGMDAFPLHDDQKPAGNASADVAAGAASMSESAESESEDSEVSDSDDSDSEAAPSSTTAVGVEAVPKQAGAAQTTPSRPVWGEARPAAILQSSVSPRRRLTARKAGHMQPQPQPPCAAESAGDQPAIPARVIARLRACTHGMMDAKCPSTLSLQVGTAIAELKKGVSELVLSRDGHVQIQQGRESHYKGIHFSVRCLVACRACGNSSAAAAESTAAADSAAAAAREAGNKEGAPDARHAAAADLHP